MVHSRLALLDKRTETHRGFQPPLGLSTRVREAALRSAKGIFGRGIYRLEEIQALVPARRQQPFQFIRVAYLVRIISKSAHRIVRGRNSPPLYAPLQLLSPFARGPEHSLDRRRRVGVSIAR